MVIVAVAISVYNHVKWPVIPLRSLSASSADDHPTVLPVLTHHGELEQAPIEEFPPLRLTGFTIILIRYSK